MQAYEVPAWGWRGGWDLQQACQRQLLLPLACEAQSWRTDLLQMQLLASLTKSNLKFYLVLANLAPAACPNSGGSQLKPYPGPTLSGGSGI